LAKFGAIPGFDIDTRMHLAVCAPNRQSHRCKIMSNTVTATVSLPRSRLSVMIGQASHYPPLRGSEMAGHPPGSAGFIAELKQRSRRTLKPQKPGPNS
jgi:hypothetical protein